MFLLKVILFPLAILYDGITRIRNRFYDLKLKPAASFEVPIISVGNLTVGGTGKTPMIEYLIRLFTPSKKIAVLSRGYGRHTKGFRIAGDTDSAKTIGDEPYQFFRKFRNNIVVAVGEDRALAIPLLVHQFDDLKAVLLDDAYQHRRVIPSLNILLTDYNRPFFRDVLLPAGRLREARKNASRADVVVVTKCPPEMKDEEMDDFKTAIERYTAKPVFFTTVRYGDPTPFGGHSQKLQEDVVLVTGIANAEPLKKYIQTKYKLVRHLAYPDHHTYSNKDLLEIQNALPPSTSVITTEKDMVKIDIAEFASLLKELPLFYLPIEVDFIKNGEDFDTLMRNVISGNA